MLIVLLLFAQIVESQLNFNKHYPSEFSKEIQLGCPKNHIFAQGLFPHTCVSYLPECLGVTQVEVKQVNGQQILCHPNYQVELTNAAIVLHNFYVDPTKSITFQVVNSVNLKYFTEHQIKDCILVYKFQVNDQIKYDCLYYSGTKVSEQRNLMMNGPATLGFIDTFNITICKGYRCDGCYPPDLDVCVKCIEDYYMTSTVRNCSLKCSIVGGLCDENGKPYDCMSGFRKVYQGATFSCTQCSSFATTCDENGPLTCVQATVESTAYISSLQNNQCVVTPNCYTYDQVTDKCTHCIPGYYVNNGVCQQCPFGCYFCTSTECQIYYSRFYYDVSQSQLASKVVCSTDCQTCLSNNPAACTTCFKNYRLDGETCICDEAQMRYEIDGICVACEEGICATCITLTECLSCKPETFRQLYGTKCYCKDGYYDDQSPDYICKKCHSSCKTCLGSEISSCTSCDSSIHRILILSQCVCDFEINVGQNKDDPDDIVCRECHPTCQTCLFQNDPQSCTSCISSQNRQLTSTQECKCIESYSDDNGALIDCYGCHFSCGSCVGGTETDCTSCIDSSHRTLSSDNRCLCTKGFFESQSTVCSACHYSCSDCLNDQERNQCTECPPSRQPDEIGLTFSCVCIDENFYDDGFNSECKQCHYSCLTCSFYGPSFCKSCDSTIRKLQYSNCKCLGRAYDDGISSCQPCFDHCLTCSGPGQTDCLTCSSDVDFRALIGGSCVCLEGYFEDNGATICSKCSYRCQTCEITKDKCLTCPENTFRDLGAGFSCSCQKGFYDKQDSPDCILCHLKCLNCSGPFETQCLSCKSLSNRTLSSNQCLCQPHYFEENVEQCTICSQTCYECVNKYDYCTSCPEDRGLVNHTCQCGTKLDGLSISKYGSFGSILCEDCHYSCLQCSGRNQNQCLSCYQVELRYFDSSTSTCPCNPGYYDSGTQVCEKCGYQCENCINSENQCLSCQQNSLRILNMQSRLCACPSGYFDDGSNSICQKCDYTCMQCFIKPNKCLTCLIDSYRQFNDVLNTCNCISGYFDNGQSICQPCHYSCFECFGLNSNQCQSCKTFNNLTKRIQLITECICQNGYYDNGFSSDCQPCDIVCVNCKSQSYQCTSCSTTRTLSINVCKCKQGYYDVGLKECLKCDSNCLECKYTAITCTACDSSVFRVLDINTQKCVCDNYYLEQNGNCIMCNNSCSSCSSTVDTCSGCSPDRILINNKCICREGYFDNQGVCKVCHKSCTSCKDTETFCLTCSIQNNRELIDNKCPCIAGYYEQISTFSCEKCDKSCKTCTQDALYCTSCDSILNYDIIQNKCLCKQECLLSCKTCDQYTKCASCYLETRQFDYLTSTCNCKQGYFEINQQNCQKCHYQCYTCQNNESYCLSCHPDVHRSLINNKCLCQNGYFDVGMDICQPCVSTCKICIDQYTKCTSCYEIEQFRKLNVNKCECQSGYFDDGTDICLKCSIQCKTCSNSADYCTSCDINQKRLDYSDINKCPCTFGFYEDLNGECQKCHIKCEMCVDQREKCLVCNYSKNNNRYPLSNQCNCLPGFYDDDIHLECQKCNKICKTCVSSSTNCLECANNLRINPPACACLDGYHEDEAQNCMKCQNQCATCITSESNCITCKPGRINKICECEAGFYEAGLEHCLRCDFKCSECSQYNNACTVCRGDRKNPPYCNCDDGYFDDGANEQCQACDYRCQTCDILGCLTCNGNRIFTNEQTCEPPLGSVSYETTPWCSNCEVAVLDVRFSDDLSFLIIRFDFKLKLLKSVNTCNTFLDDITLELLGFGFDCKIDELDDQNIIITLGQEPQILVGDQIIFMENSLQHIDCDKKLQKFIFNMVKGPQNLLEPLIQFDVPNYGLSSCIENIIYSNFTACHGNRKFSLINWSYKIQEKENTQELDDFINVLNNNQEFDIIVIPVLTLPENENITFYIQIQNFIGTQSISSFILNTQLDSQPIVKVDLKKKYFTYQQIEIPFTAQIITCHSQISQKTYQFQIDLIETSRSNKFSQSSNINYSVISNNTDYSITIPKYQLTPQTIYEFSLKVNETSTLQFSEQQFAIEIYPADLLCQFENAVNIQDFKKDLLIKVVCKDLNTNLNWNEDPLIQIEIFCIDLSTTEPCLDQNQKKIDIFQQQYEQKVPKHSVRPFTVQSWQIVATKENLRNKFEQIIVFLEYDSIPLNVEHNIAYKFRPINNFEMLDFKYQIPSSLSNKVVEMSIGIVEDFNIIKFQLFNQQNKYSLKFSVQYSTNINPSLYNLPITLNSPPICPDFKQIENSYQGLTNIEIIVNCARSEDSPYQYKFGYFLSEEEMQVYLNRSSGSILGLQVFQSSPKLNMIIPNSFQNNPIRFIIFVMDQGGSITNLFGQTTVVKSFNCSSDQILSLSQKSLSIEIAFLIQALGQEGQQCQDLSKKVQFDLLTKTNLNNEELNFWMKAIKIYKSYSQASNTRLLFQESQNSTCFDEEKKIFYINSTQLNEKQQSQSKSYEQLENDFRTSTKIITILSNQYLELDSLLKDLTVDWNQNLYSQYQESISTLQLSMLLIDDILTGISLMNNNDTRLLELSQESLSKLDYISKLLSNTAKVNGGLLEIEGKVFNWKFQRLTRQKLNENLRRDTVQEDIFVQYSQKEQIELNFNPYKFSDQLDKDIVQMFNVTKIILDPKQMIKLKLSNFNAYGKLIEQKKIDSGFQIEMHEIQVCQKETEKKSNEDFKVECLQLTDGQLINSCKINVIPQQFNFSNFVQLNCLCSTFGETFLFYYQNITQNSSIDEQMSFEYNLQGNNLSIYYQSVSFYCLITYVTIVIVGFLYFLFKRNNTNEIKQETQEVNDDDKLKRQIICYPGIFPTIKQNFKYLHSITAFYYENLQRIPKAFSFIDLNNQFSSIVLIEYLFGSFLPEWPIYIEISILLAVGTAFRMFSKILQGFVRINNCFLIIIYCLEVLLFIMIWLTISVLISMISQSNEQQKLIIIGIATLILFLITESMLVSFSVFTYQIVYKSIKQKEFNPIYHLLYYFAYHERLEIIFHQYQII